jgi:hypothetical protein
VKCVTDKVVVVAQCYLESIRLGNPSLNEDCAFVSTALKHVSAFIVDLYGVILHSASALVSVIEL